MGQEDLEKQRKGAQGESPRTGPFGPELEDIPVLPPLLDAAVGLPPSKQN